MRRRYMPHAISESIAKRFCTTNETIDTVICIYCNTISAGSSCVWCEAERMEFEHAEECSSRNVHRLSSDGFDIFKCMIPPLNEFDVCFREN